MKSIMFLFSLYFSSLNLKYLKLTKMNITSFAMKLFIQYLSIHIYQAQIKYWDETAAVTIIKVSEKLKVCRCNTYVH